MNFLNFSGPKPTSYKIYYRKTSDLIWKFVAIPFLSVKGIIQDLVEDTQYEVYVVAYNKGFAGSKSKQIIIKTPKKGRCHIIMFKIKYISTCILSGMFPSNEITNIVLLSFAISIWIYFFYRNLSLLWVC